MGKLVWVLFINLVNLYWLTLKNDEKLEFKILENGLTELNFLIFIFFVKFNSENTPQIKNNSSQIHKLIDSIEVKSSSFLVPQIFLILLRTQHPLDIVHNMNIITFLNKLKEIKNRGRTLNKVTQFPQL